MKISTILTIMVTILLCGLALSSYAMRCHNELVNEGDTVISMHAKCGPVSTDMHGLFAYINKDADGMNYYIHADSNDIIDSIQFSRGGLR